MILALLATVAVGGKTVARTLAQGSLGPWTVARVAPYLAVAAAIALATAWFLVAGRGLVRRRRVIALVTLAVVDLLVFTANQSSLAPVRASELGRSSRFERALAAAVGANGRFVIVDHYRVGGAELNELGATNLNVFTQLSSAQGYGSLTWAPYADATGTHGQNRAGPGAFSSGVFDRLDVRALLVLPWAFGVPVTPANPGLVALARSTPTTRYFGGGVDVASVGILAARGAGRRVLGAEARRHPSPRHASAVRAPPASPSVRPSATAYFRRGLRSVGLVLAASGGGPRSVACRGGRPAAAVLADRTARRFVTPPHWGVAGTIGVYLWLTDTRAIGPFTAFTPSGTRRPAADVRVVASSPWTPTETVEVDAARRCSSSAASPTSPAGKRR